MPGLVGLLRSAAGALGEGRGLGTDERPLLLCGRPGPLEALRAGLAGGDERAVRAFALQRRLGAGDVPRLEAAAVVVYGGEIGAALDAATRAELEILGTLRVPRLLLLEALDLPSQAAGEAGLVPGLTPDDLLPYKRGHLAPERVLRALAAHSGDAGPSLAHRLPALRPYVVDELSEATARRAAAIAGALVVPGADLPALSALQLALVLRIGACYGEAVSSERAVELVGVLGAALGLRAVARELLDLVPGLGWAAKAAVAYAGTRALARAADLYFAGGAPAGFTRLRASAPLARRLRRPGAGRQLR